MPKPRCCCCTVSSDCAHILAEFVVPSAMNLVVGLSIAAFFAVLIIKLAQSGAGELVALVAAMFVGGPVCMYLHLKLTNVFSRLASVAFGLTTGAGEAKVKTV